MIRVNRSKQKLQSNYRWSWNRICPPTVEELENLIGKVSLIDIIPEAGLQNYGASIDISKPKLNKFF